ncbi:JHBP domain containing protein, partial [Asbolus verrucosus]
LDLEKKTASLDFDFPEIKIQAEYDVNGKILLLPVYGKGPATINLEHVSGTVTFHFEEYEKKGKKFLKVAASELTLNPKLVRFNFENLFDGDKALGDNINKVLNENWEEVFKDIQTNYEEAFNQIAA